MATGDENNNIVIQNAAAVVPLLSLPPSSRPSARIQPEEKVPDVADLETIAENDPATDYSDCRHSTFSFEILKPTGNGGQLAASRFPQVLYS